MLTKRLSSQDHSQGEFETTQDSRAGMGAVIKGVIFFGAGNEGDYFNVGGSRWKNYWKIHLRDTGISIWSSL